jgi:hypothetical protein
MANIKIPKEFRDRNTPTDVTIEQWNWSIRYRRIMFRDPDEALVLPASIESMLVHRNSNGVTTRLRTTQTFAKYRRFVTESRLIP